MITVKINDSFPGASKGMTKTLPDEIAKDLIANKWGTEVKEKAKTAAELKAEKDAQDKADAEAKAKEDAEAAARQDKIDKDATGTQTK